VEGVVLNSSFWRDRAVFVTGHTGFKGSWLCLALSRAGARVSGFALEPPTAPAVFDVARVADLLVHHTIGDIREPAALQAAMIAAQPDIVFHLAAQPLVRASYIDPVLTYATNVMGSVNVFEAARGTNSVRAIVSVTTDKCYENREWLWAYREDEPLGGHDPYSSSKACAELVTAAYRASFFSTADVAIASARAGNVIGGGDWASDRLVPDFLRASDRGEPTLCRRPDAVRPWQHVLEPVSGYIRLAEALIEDPRMAAEAWNFGPADEDARPVSWILDRLTQLDGAPAWVRDELPHAHEAGLLKVDSSKARSKLGWLPSWNLEGALERTVTWHRAWRAGDDMRSASLAQIAAHDFFA